MGTSCCDENIDNDNERNTKTNNTFPIGSKYEKELNSNFKYFNVFWFDQNKTCEYKYYKNCFINVQFIASHNLIKTINFFEKEYLSDWIVIITGIQEKELIQNLENNNCIKAFYIYSHNIKFHDEWTKNIKKIECITSNPEILCQKLIELNSIYLIPNFNYKSIINTFDIDFASNENEKYNVNLFISNSITLKQLITNKKSKTDKYNNLCIKMYHYLDDNKIDNDSRKKNIENNTHLILSLKELNPNNEDIQIMINNLKDLALLSLYFNKFPYIYNLLTAEEVKDIFKNKNIFELIISKELSFFSSLEKLVEKIKKNESILDFKDEMKEIQIYIIYLLKMGFIEKKLDPTSSIEYYQVINYFRDIDFCIKLLFTYECLSVFSVNSNSSLFLEIDLTLIICDFRYHAYSIYLRLKEFNKNKFSEKEQKIINNSLKIKDFIVVGDEQFQEKIKFIESFLEFNSLKYLTIDEISNYVNEKLKVKGKELAKYFYFLIIRVKEYQDNYKNLFKLSIKTGITFLAIIYVENENNINFYKEQFNYPFPTILVYSLQDIKSYFSRKLNFIDFSDYPEPEEIGDLYNINIPKISFEQNGQDKFQNGCFELAENFDFI